MAKPLSVEEKAHVADQRRVEQQQEREKRAKEKAAMGSLWSRRDVFGRFGWGVFTAFSGLTLLGFLRSAFPRVLFTPPSTFKAGVPADFIVGEVSTKFQKDQRVWIIREDKGMYALWAKCTHLGCTPRWLTAENKFKCPCHGSGFRRTGINFEGPAPRPLERCKIALADDGQLLVDKSVKFQQEKGEWTNDEAFLKL